MACHGCESLEGVKIISPSLMLYILGDNIHAHEKEEIMKLMTEQEVAGMLKISVHKLRRDRNIGGGLPFIKLGGAVRYSMAALEDWLASRTFSSTSQVTAS